VATAPGEPIAPCCSSHGQSGIASAGSCDLPNVVTLTSGLRRRGELPEPTGTFVPCGRSVFFAALVGAVQPSSWSTYLKARFLATTHAPSLPIGPHAGLPPVKRCGRAGVLRMHAAELARSSPPLAVPTTRHNVREVTGGFPSVGNYSGSQRSRICVRHALANRRSRDPPKR
jgi:hypothetical protein